MTSRSDTEFYYNSAESMKNFIGITQGGFTRRFGTRYLNYVGSQVARISSGITPTAPNGGTAANAYDDDLGTTFTTTTTIGTTNNYVAIKLDYGSVKNVDFVDLDEYELTVSGSTDEFVIQGSSDDISYTTLASLTVDTTPRTTRWNVFSSFRYIRVIRIGTTDLGTNTIQFNRLNTYTSGSASNVKQIDFEFSEDQNYQLILTHKNIAIYEDGVLLNNVRADAYTSAFIPNTNWTQSADTLILVNPDVAPATLVRDSSDDTIWTLDVIDFEYIPKFAFTVTTSNPAADITPSDKDGEITITASASVFTAASVEQYIEGNGGRARILTYVSGTEVTAKVLIPFINTNAIVSGDWTYETGYEDAWSSSRGWPVSSAFYEERLWFGGSKSIVDTIWGSRSKQFFNFDQGALYDDEAIIRTLTSSQLNAIVNIFPQRTLQVFTVGSEWSLSTALDGNATPQNARFIPTTKRGSEKGLRVFENEGYTLFVQKNGQSILSYIFDDNQQNYADSVLSIYSSHLVDDPQAVALKKATSTEESAQYYLVTGGGRLTVGTIFQTQGVASFSDCFTDGEFISVGVEGSLVYFIVERELNGQTVRTVELADDDVTLDSAIYQDISSPTTTITGLDHLEGETVEAIGDGYYLGEFTVEDGQIESPIELSEYISVGLCFDVLLKTHRMEIPSFGPMVGRKKRISEVDLRLFETQNILVNGNNPVTFRRFGSSSVSPLDKPVAAFTGEKQVKGLLGWDYDGQVNITQSVPMTCTVLAMGMKVSFGN